MPFTGYTPGTYILGPSHYLRITVNANQIGLSGTIYLDGDRTMFTAKSDDELVKNDTIDNGGMVVGTRVPSGWSGSVEVDKASDDFDQLMMLLDAAYYAGPVNGAPSKVDFTMTEVITLASGQQVTNQYTGVVFHGYDAGSWKRKDIVQSKVEFFATQKISL